jgi:hypothetical protein
MKRLLVAGCVLALASACTPPTTPTTTAPRGVHTTSAPAGDVAGLVGQQLATSNAQGRRVLVSVGAPWCEPCVRFHDAVARGDFDDVLAGVDLVEFNLDVDRARLEQAGYGSRMIPLLAVPGSDGRGGALRLEGSVKGEAAVADLRQRLGDLLR